MQVYSLEPILLDTSIAIGLYKNVANTTKLKELAGNGTIKAAFIKADMIVDVFQLLVAINKAFFMKTQNKLKTKTVFSEILFWLSPSNKISECFKLFGVDDFTSNVLIITNPDDYEKVHDLVKGDLSDLSTLDENSNKELLINLYKISDVELKNTSLLNCIVSQLSAKEIR